MDWDPSHCRLEQNENIRGNLKVTEETRCLPNLRGSGG